MTGLSLACGLPREALVAALLTLAPPSTVTVAAGTFALVTVWDLEAVAGPENMGAIQIHHDDWLVLTRARGRALVTSKGAVILLVTTDTGTHVMVWGMETLKRRIEFKDVGSTILPTNSFPLPEQPVMTPDGVPCAYLHQNDQVQGPWEQEAAMNDTRGLCR